MVVYITCDIFVGQDKNILMHVWCDTPQKKKTHEE